MGSGQLPWDSLSGPVYRARVLKPRKRWVTAGCWILCAFLIVFGLATRYRIGIVFGVLYILVLLMKKDIAVTDRGLEIYYQMRITTHYDFWPWEEMAAVIREDRRHPEMVALHFGRGNSSKQFFFTRRDSGDIMDMARKKNKKILVRDADESEMVGYKRYNRHY